MENTENFLIPEGEQCPFLKTKKSVFLNTKLPFVVRFV